MKKHTDTLLGSVIIMSCYFLGEILSSVTGLPFPGNLLGMLLLLAGLLSGFIKIEWVEGTARFLVNNLALLLVPLGVGTMVSWSLIAHDIIPISVATFFSTFLVMGITAWVFEKIT
ncbi:MAG TPA: CidA/LrgA family protein, partial [Bacillota bacterium]|nr:CidA/LrgA family protein [Bacillota bacterium]